MPCVVDLAAMRDAVKRLGADPKKINPLVPVDLVIDHSVQVDVFGNVAALERNAEIEFDAQQGALRVPALGPEGVLELPRRAARDRHRAPGEPRVPRRAACSRRSQGAETGGVSRLARRHRLAHHDDQRPRRGRLGRRRHRGRGGHARPAALPAHAAGRGLQAHRPAARRRHRHRPRADRHADAAQEGRRRQVRRVLRSRPVGHVAARPRDDREHGARVRRDDGLLPGGRRDAALPRAHRAHRRGPAHRGVLQGAGPVPHRRDARAGVHRHAGARPRRRRGVPRRPQAPAGPRRAARHEAHVPQGPRRRRSRSAASASPRATSRARRR